jgi:hypothetical protein
MEAVKNAVMVGTAEGADLDVLGRNYGVLRPLVTDAVYRELLQVLIAAPAGTIETIERILDVLVGSGNYEVYELFPSEPNRVYISIGATAGDVSEGRFFLPYTEEQDQTGTYTVDVDFEPFAVGGIWEHSDPERAGTNYALQPTAITYAAPDRIVAAVPTWTAADVGGGVELGSGVWIVAAVLSPLVVQLVGDRGVDGAVNGGTPAAFDVGDDVFAAWMVGHNIALQGENAGVYEILTVVGSRRVLLDRATPWRTEAGVGWELRPLFTAGSGTVRLHRATISGATITAPVALPATVLVDYVVVPSGQLLASAAVDGNAQYPGYLSDDTALVQSVVDVITVAGVEAVVEAS